MFTRSGAKALVGCAAAISLALTAAPASATTTDLPPNPCLTQLTVANPTGSDVEVAYLCVYNFWTANRDGMPWSSSFNFHEAIQDAMIPYYEGGAPSGALAALLAAFDLVVPAGDPSGLGDLLNNYPDDSKKDNYTPESWQPCGAARVAAETALANPGRFTQAEIDAMAAALILHCGALVLKPPLDTSELEDLLDDFPGDSDKDDYTPGSWGPCAAARAAAEALLANLTGVTQAEVDAAAAALILHCGALVLKADVSELVALLDKYPDATQRDRFTPGSWEPCGTARAVAWTYVPDPGNATQAQIDAAAAALILACDALVLKPPDTSELEDLLDDLPGGSDKDDYTPGSWGPCAAARAAAEALLANLTGVTQAEVDAAAAALVLHCGALVLKADVSVLAALLDSYPDYNDKDLYTSESWRPCGDARGAAWVFVPDPGDHTQAQVDAAAAALILACDALVLKPGPPPPPGVDKKVLGDELAAADKLVEDLYTPESWAGLVKARDAARTVANNAGASQAEVDAAVKALKDAVAALVLKPNLDPRASVVRVKAAQLTVTLVRGKKMTVPAFGYNGYNKATKVSYSSSKSKVASVTKKGKITAKKVGTATVTVKAVNGLTLKIKVKVVAKKPVKVVKLKVKVAGVKKSMKVGKVAYANVTFKPKNAVGVKVTFKSTKKSVVAVDKAGRLLAKKKGKATIIFKAGKATKKIKVTVK